MKFKFKVERGGLNPSAINIISDNKSATKSFPAPYEPFTLVIDDVEYTTSRRNLKSGYVSVAKTRENGTGRKITREELCLRHGLQEGQVVYIEAIAGKKVYRLNKA